MWPIAAAGLSWFETALKKRLLTMRDEQLFARLAARLPVWLGCGARRRRRFQSSTWPTISAACCGSITPAGLCRAAAVATPALDTLAALTIRRARPVFIRASRQNY
jgi:hypothetical protein